MFGNDVRAFVPQIAMSAGTMLACSCKEIWLGTHSNLGPVDPSVNGIQAQAVLAEIESAFSEMMKDRNRVLVWNPILSRYTPSFLQLCKWAVERAEDFVTKALMDNMFSALPEDDRKKRATAVVASLTDLSKNKGHDRHLHYDECKSLGLEVKALESDKGLQDLVLTVHHCYMHTLANTGAFKIIENHMGRRMVKIEQQFVVMQKTPKPATPSPNPSGPAH
jgi:hypothetical protein